jgi:TIR domain
MNMYLTKAFIRNFALQESSQKAVRDYNDRVQFSARHRVFLSHSHIDATDISKEDLRNLVTMLIAFCKAHNFEVYVDWLDPDMPRQTCETTAQRLKEKIDGSDRFLLAATTNAVNSRWVPWELGYADKSRGVSNIAVIPIADPYGNWEGAEYLRLYPTAQVASSGNVAVFKPSATQNGIHIGYWMENGG